MAREELPMRAGLILLVLGCFGAPILAAPEGDPIQIAVQKGIKYLQGTHRPVQGYNGGSHGMGSATLAGLALLEAGVPVSDPAVMNITKYVRDNALTQTGTYEVSLTIMFLDRLGQKADVPIIQFLGLRLIGGQNYQGGWHYDCGYALNAADEARLRRVFLNETRLVLTPTKPDPLKKDGGKKEPVKDVPRTDLPSEFVPLPLPMQPSLPKPTPMVMPPPKKDVPVQKLVDENTVLHPEVVKWAKLVNLPTTNAGEAARPGNNEDNSNTQFAALGVWCARKYGVPCDKAIALLDKRFRTSQSDDGGWGYKYEQRSSTPAMTCAGLISLAVALGNRENVLKNRPDNPAAKPDVAGVDDPFVLRGLKCLGNYISQAKGLPPDGPVAPAKKGGKRFKIDELNSNLYFLWSLERVGVIYSLETIGNHDWYTWGADGLLQTQQANGSWHNKGYPGANDEINTSLALLFLSRANVARDLTALLDGKTKDPGVAVLKGGNVKLIPDPKVVEPIETDAQRLSRELIATPAARPALIEKLRDSKGTAFTDALALAAVRLSGEPQQQVREAMVKRLSRMTAATLREMLTDENAEIRLGAAGAAGAKEDRQLIPALIEVLMDKNGAVASSAHVSLKRLSGKEFPATAISVWREWWKSQGM